MYPFYIFFLLQVLARIVWGYGCFVLPVYVYNLIFFYLLCSPTYLLVSWMDCFISVRYPSKLWCDVWLSWICAASVVGICISYFCLEFYDVCVRVPMYFLPSVIASDLVHTSGIFSLCVDFPVLVHFEFGHGIVVSTYACCMFSALRGCIACALHPGQSLHYLCTVLIVP